MKTGEKVKGLRSQRGITLRELSRATGLSVSHLSQFERGQGTLSLYSLERVATALGVQMSYFLEASAHHGGYFSRGYSYNPVSLPESDLLYNRLGNSLPQCNLEPMEVTILPGTPNEDAYPKAHQGEEFIFVLEGILTVLIDNEEYQLNPGDSMHYQAKAPHEWLNLTPHIVRLISVNTPRIIPL